MADDAPGGPPEFPEAPSPGVLTADGTPGSPIGGRKTGWRRWLPLAAVISGIAVCAIVMLFILGRNNGVVGLIVGLSAAILPVPVLVGCFLWLDRYEPEPSRYLVFCFAWGSAVATPGALGVNQSGGRVFHPPRPPPPPGARPLPPVGAGAAEG